MRKYRNKRTTTADGQVFDSLKEARRWNVLQLLQEAGEIMNLQRQVKYVLIPTQKIDGKIVERECSYIADFVYTDRMTGELVVEDVKGYRQANDPAYRIFVIKRKLMLKEFGIVVKEV